MGLQDEIRVIKRTGDIVIFSQDKIELAVKKAFLSVDEYKDSNASTSIFEKTKAIATAVTNALKGRVSGEGRVVNIEEIQDQVELALMRSGEQKVARSYVLYREDRAKQREKEQHPHHAIKIKNKNGDLVDLDYNKIKQAIITASHDLTGVDPIAIADESIKNLYNGVNASDISTTIIMACRTKIESEPNYSYLTARLLRDNLFDVAFDYFGLPETTENDLFPIYLKEAVKLELVDPALLSFDLDRLSKVIKPSRTDDFTYLGLQTLVDRYFVKTKHGVRIETPQAFFMRVAMGLAINEKDREASAIEFYENLSTFDFMSSTPTLFNAGSLHPQLSSCYLTTLADDLYDIYSSMRDNAMLSKWSGGIGNDWTPVRGLNSYIKGTNGKSQGTIPFLKVSNDTAVAVNQGGKRKGAICAYLETFHLDVEEFSELRKNTGDDRRRTHDMNTAHWIPDLFMQRVFDDADWTLFTPSETPDLHELYGEAFTARYEYYESIAKEQGLLHKVLKAKDLWRKMLSMLFETGHPWFTFKDPCNIRSPQQHVGVVHSSNLCTEITLNTSKEEIAVCNLGSINLVKHIVDGVLDREKLRKTIKTAIRMLDNVVDVNYYPVPQAETSNLKHRPIGLGLMGFHDALYKLNIPYSSNEAIAFADESMEIISYYAIEASHELALEKGSYESFDGSLWSQGIVPLDTIKMLKDSRPQGMCEMDESYTLDWDVLRTKVRLGMRNSNVMAIAPTATIANICGVSQSIEPTFENLYVKSNLSGEFTVINPYLVDALKDLDLWDNAMVNDLKHFEGSVQQIARIPDWIKIMFATAFEIEPKWLVECASRRQKWIDQSQSLNLYIANADGRKLDLTYKMAWLKGLKTTYYLRAKGATSAEKSTVTTGALNAVKIQPKDDKKDFLENAQPNACPIDGSCESCQ